MELLTNFIGFFLHLDHHVHEVIRDYGIWTYLIVFIIIFCETGLVVTPFLPGDSLLFVLGTFAATGSLHVGWVIGLLIAAAVLGDTVNYWIGNILAPRVLRNEKIRFIKQVHLVRTQKFYEKYGGMTIILARFIPIIRTFAPFLAGVASMRYWRFALFNVAGGALWILAFVLGGYFFGNLPVVKKNFSLVVLAIIVISVIPAFVEYFRHRHTALEGK